jgi:hypothetical protein
MLPMLIPAGIAALSSLFGSKGQKTEQQGQRNTSSNTSFDNTSMPMWDEQTMLGRDVALQGMIGRSAGLPAFLDAYQTRGIQGINDSTQAKRQMIENLMTSRGLGRTSMGASAMAGAEGDRINQIAGFKANVPMVGYEMGRQNDMDLGRFVSSLPIGQRSMGSGSSESTEMTKGSGFQSNPSNPFDAISQIAANLAGRNFMNGGGSQPKPIDRGNY